ncbi:MAG: hypothetical protein ACNA7W_06420 [Pseudomonadales bacterium]
MDTAIPTIAERKSNPSRHFSEPAEVLKAGDLSHTDKIEVLRNWANELRQLQVAEEENMRGASGVGSRLQAVEQALLQLGETDTEHDAKA